MATTATEKAPKGEAALPKPEPHVLVLFGATGDLASQAAPRALPPRSGGADARGVPIVGSSLTDLDDEGFREHVRDALGEFCRMDISDDEWDPFGERLSYVQSKADALSAGRREAPSEALGQEARRLHYLSVPPSAAVRCVPRRWAKPA